MKPWFVWGNIIANYYRRHMEIQRVYEVDLLRHVLFISRYIHCRHLGSGSSLVPSTCEFFLGSQIRLTEPEPVLEAQLARVLFVPKVGQLRPRRSITLIIGMLSDEAHDGQGPLLHPPVV